VARSFLSLGSKATSAWAAIIAGGVLTVAGVNISVIYGAWLQSEYGLQPAALGATALVVGIADLTGSVLVSLFADRLGTRRSTLLGCCVMLVAFALLPILNCGLAPALVGLAFMRFAFEFATVSTIPLLCEQAPSERGKVLGLATASGLAGAVIASVTGPWTFTSFGVVGVAIVSLAATAATALVVAAWVRDARIEASASPLP
jgi:predicted MFS family arabinose efflux permease